MILATAGEDFITSQGLHWDAWEGAWHAGHVALEGDGRGWAVMLDLTTTIGMGGRDEAMVPVRRGCKSDSDLEFHGQRLFTRFTGSIK